MIPPNVPNYLQDTRMDIANGGGGVSKLNVKRTYNQF